MLIDHLNRQRLERDALGLTRLRRVAESPCAPRKLVSQGGQPARELVVFGSNDYLGFANHPALIQALAEGAQQFGAGSGASHLISGHSRAHAALEGELASRLEPCIPNAEALYFCTGFLANIALLTALGGASATIFADKLNHASLINGALMAKAPMQRYAHRNLTVLASQLERCATPIKLIATGAVFSMDGDLADLPTLLELAERFDAWLIVDDAHGFGVLGTQGRGSLSHFGLRSERLIYIGTLGKAAGVGGAFVAAHPAIIDWLVQSARAYIYTTAAPPSVAHALRESLRLIGSAEADQRRAQLQQRISQLRAEHATLIAAHPALGWRLADSSTAIQPLIVGSNEAALALMAVLDPHGLWVPAIRPPTVPVGTARLRITLSAVHSTEDVQRLVDGLALAARELS